MLLSTAESSAYSAQEVAARLRVDVRTGLRWSEANSRSKIVGYNELNALDDEPPWMKYVQQFKNPLILLLLGKRERERKYECANGIGLFTHNLCCHIGFFRFRPRECLYATV